MSKQKNKPLTQQIYEKFLELIKEEPDLESDVIEKLTALVEKGDLQKSQQVIKALKDSQEQKK